MEKRAGRPRPYMAVVVRAWFPRPRFRTPTLGQIVAYFKYQTTKSINQMREMPGARFWQRNYWEHVIRDETDLNRIRRYIQTNPLRWVDDQLHPDAPPNKYNRG